MTLSYVTTETLMWTKSSTHPRAVTYVTDAAAMQGSAAEKRDALKYRGNNGHHHPGYTFILASVETYDYLGKLLVRYLNNLNEVAAARGLAVTKGWCTTGTQGDVDQVSRVRVWRRRACTRRPKR